MGRRDARVMSWKYLKARDMFLSRDFRLRLRQRVGAGLVANCWFCSYISSFISCLCFSIFFLSPALSIHFIFSREKKTGQDDWTLIPIFCVNTLLSTYPPPQYFSLQSHFYNLRTHRTWTSIQHLLLIHAGRVTFILLLPLSTSSPPTSSHRPSLTRIRPLNICSIQQTPSCQMYLSPQMPMPSKSWP